MTGEPEPKSAPESTSDSTRIKNLAATAGVVTIIVGAVILQVCSGSSPNEAEARCDALLDRFVELRVRAANPKASEHFLEERKQAAKDQAERTQALETCREQLTEDMATCAEKAMSADQLEQCFP